MLKRWNLGLIIGTFLLSIFGTFITRSGRHRQRAQLHPVQRRLLLPRLPRGRRGARRSRCSTPAGPMLEAEVQLESMLSREAAFLFNNLLLVGIAFSVLWGTLFPILSEAVRGTKITVGPPFFNRVNVPLGLLLLALTGIGPLIAWRKASAANLRRQFVAPLAHGRRRPSSALLAAGMRDLYPLMALASGRVRGRHDRPGVLSRSAGAPADARRVGPGRACSG